MLYLARRRRRRPLPAQDLPRPQGERRRIRTGHEPRDALRRHRHNRYEYVQNAPVSINGGPGIDTIVVIGTPIGDDFIVTDTYVAGAGRIVSLHEHRGDRGRRRRRRRTDLVLSTSPHVRDDRRRRLGRRHDPHRRHPAAARLRPAVVHLHAAGVRGAAAAGARRSDPVTWDLERLHVHGRPRHVARARRPVLARLRRPGRVGCRRPRDHPGAGQRVRRRALALESRTRGSASRPSTASPPAAAGAGGTSSRAARSRSTSTTSSSATRPAISRPARA